MKKGSNKWKADVEKRFAIFFLCRGMDEESESKTILFSTASKKLATVAVEFVVHDKLSVNCICFLFIEKTLYYLKDRFLSFRNNKLCEEQATNKKIRTRKSKCCDKCRRRREVCLI